MIFPETQHLKIVMYASTVTGSWPFIFEDNPILKKLYNIYSNVIMCSHIFYTICVNIEFIILITKDVIDISEVVTILGVALINSIAVLRIRVINGNGIKSIILKVMAFEKKMLTCTDENIIKIHKSHVKQSQNCSLIFIVNIIINYFFFIGYPLTMSNTVIFNAATNDTITIKPLPLNIWLPFDQQKYYSCAYVWYAINCLAAILIITAADTYIFSLIIFFLGQIKVLKQILTEFQKNAVKVQNQLQCTRDEASFVTLRECILKHKEIIEYVQQYNDELRTVMLLDFLQSSIQLASIFLNLLVIEKNVLSIAWYGTFVCTISYTLSANYWYANEIMEHSSDIGAALYNSKWYEEPIKVRKMMVVMMLRCNTPLCLEIGMFGTMTLNTFIGILKATYSYMMLVYNNKEE